MVAPKRQAAFLEGGRGKERGSLVERGAMVVIVERSSAQLVRTRLLEVQTD